MSANVTPKFFIDIDGRKFGARLLPISDIVQTQVDIERLSNGSYSSWLKSENLSEQSAAFSLQAAVILNKAIVAWPADMPKIDFLECDDESFVLAAWEALNTESARFREQRLSAGKSPSVGAPIPPQAVASSDVQSTPVGS